METGLDCVREGLDALGAKLGSSLTLDADNACAFSLSNGLICTVEYVDLRDALLIWTELMTVPEQDRVRLFERALTANANPFQLGGTSIGFDPAKSSLTLSFVSPLSRLDPGAVGNSISTFALIASDLRELLMSDDEVGVGATNDADLVRMGQFIRG